MIKKTITAITGIAFLFVLSVVINLGISLKLLLPSNIIEWAGESYNAQLTLWIISVLFSSFILALLSLGIKLPFIKPWVERPDHPVYTYIFGLPLWAILSIFVLSGLSLFFLGPVCESPFAVIEASTLNKNDLVDYDGNIITARAGSKLTLSATVKDNSVVFCSWSSTGEVIKTIVPQSSCITQASLSPEPGKGIITLTLSKNFCSLRSITPLELIVIP